MLNTRRGGVLADAVACSASFNSDVLECFGGEPSMQFYSSATGDRAGSISVQVSNDGTNWVTVPFNDSSGSPVTSISVVASTELNVFAGLLGNARYYRGVFTHSAGTTGTMTITAHANHPRG